MVRLIFIAIAVVAGGLLVPLATQNQQLSWRNLVNSIAHKKAPSYVLHDLDCESENIVIESKGEYDSVKAAISSSRIALKKKYETASIEEKPAVLKEASILFTESLLNEIIPHWYGTEWDYNGYTDIPGEGQVACGYFVSTTLKHIGVNVNRYKLAQTYSLQAVKVLQGGNAINLWGVGQDSFCTYIEAQKDGFYVVGLDHHIGYVLKRKGKAYFLNSSNLWPGTVCIESARKTLHFRWTNSFMLCDLSNNDSFLKKWLLSEAFVVP